MKKNRVFKTVLALALAASCFAVAGALVGCGSSNNDNQTNDDKALKEDTGLTGGVAATVNGTEIEEDKVTRRINTIRVNNQLEEDKAWGEYLAQYSETPSSLRETILDSFIDQELVLQFAEERGATTDDEEIQSYVDKMRNKYTSDEAWQKGLEGAGFDDENAYRDALRYSILYKKIAESFGESGSSGDAGLLEFVNQGIAQYDGARKSSHILFDLEDEGTAQQVLNQINAGTLDFKEAAKEYSKDTGSAENGGDVGWDVVNSFVTEYQTALGELEKGQVSALVKSQYGWHIIKCTDVFKAPSKVTKLSQVPNDILAKIKTSYTESENSEAVTNWLKDKRETSEVVINDMPENVPYNIDMSPYESSEEQTAIDDTTNAETTADVAGTEMSLEDLEAQVEGSSSAAAEGEK